MKTELKPWMTESLRERASELSSIAGPVELRQIAIAIEATLATPKQEPVGDTLEVAIDKLIYARQDEWGFSLGINRLKLRDLIVETVRALSPPPPALHERDEDGHWICCCGDSLPVSEAMERDHRESLDIIREGALFFKGLIDDGVFGLHPGTEASAVCHVRAIEIEVDAILQARENRDE